MKKTDKKTNQKAVKKSSKKSNQKIPRKGKKSIQSNCFADGCSK